MQQARRRSQTRMVAGTLAIAALVGAACGTGGTVAEDAAVEPSAAETTESVGQALSGEFETISGATIDLADFDGRDVVLWFWAPW